MSAEHPLPTNMINSKGRKRFDVTSGTSATAVSFRVISGIRKQTPILRLRATALALRENGRRMVPQRIDISDNVPHVLKSLGKLCLPLLLMNAFVWTAAAHDIPNDIAIQTFLKPEGRQLHYLVRIPLKAIREVDFPLRGPGYLDLTRIDGYLRDAAIQWVAQFTEIDEANTPLPKPAIVETRVS